jgi:hypothetical protein
MSTVLRQQRRHVALYRYRSPFRAKLIKNIGLAAILISLASTAFMLVKSLGG